MALVEKVRATKEAMEDRKAKLAAIINKLKDEGAYINSKTLIKHMRQHYTWYTHNHLLNDKRNLNLSNTFVSDLAKFNYSAIIQDMFEDIDKVNKAANELMTVEDPKYSNWCKRQGASLLTESVRLRNDILSGKALNISVELLARELARTKDRLNKAMKNNSDQVYKLDFVPEKANSPS